MAKKNGAANARGVSEIDLGYRSLKLKVTLAAMADAEDAFECDFSEIEDHLGSTRALAKLIVIMAKAAGETFEDEAAEIEKIRRAPVELSSLMASFTGATSTGEALAKNAEAPTR